MYKYETSVWKNIYFSVDPNVTYGKYFTSCDNFTGNIVRVKTSQPYDIRISALLRREICFAGNSIPDYV